MMNWADYSILILILLSAILSYFKGFVKEIFSFLAWLFSFIIALLFFGELASLLTRLIPFFDLRLGLSFIILFLICFVLIGGLNDLILSSIAPTPLSVSERSLGIIFGIAKGGIIVTLLLMLSGLTRFPTTTWWQESVLIHHFKPIIVVLRSQLPSDIATQFNFQPASK